MSRVTSVGDDEGNGTTINNTSDIIPLKPYDLIVKEEYASLIPHVSEQEYQTIRQSMEDNGQWVPIIVNAQRIILDATDIRESSPTTKRLVHTLVRTGAIEEIARAILETTIAFRDITNLVNETVKDLKERGTIKDTASAGVETTNETRNTIGIAKSAIDADNTN